MDADYVSLYLAVSPVHLPYISPDQVQEYMDAYYVSLAPPTLTRLAEEGYGRGSASVRARAMVRVSVRV